MHNIHATGVILRDRGVLIMGPSGSGKSTLALDLLDSVRMAGGFARIVCDDQVFIEDRSGRLLARAAAPIAGLVEIRGIGPCAVEAEPAMTVDLVVCLVPATMAPRIWNGETATLKGIGILRLDLPERGGASAVSAVAAMLGLPGGARRTQNASK